MGVNPLLEEKLSILRSQLADLKQEEEIKRMEKEIKLLERKLHPSILDKIANMIRSFSLGGGLQESKPHVEVRNPPPPPPIYSSPWIGGSRVFESPRSGGGKKPYSDDPDGLKDLARELVGYSEEEKED